jgi:hypothetical protein
VLQTILPGFRHLRAPLAAGYVWILAIWLLFRDVLQSRERASVLHGVGDIANWVGKPAALAAVTLVAYLAGIVSIATTKGINRFAGRLTNTRMGWLSPGYWTDKQIENLIDDAVHKRLTEHYADNEQFRGLLTEHLTYCRNRASSESKTLGPWLTNLPHTARLEKEAMQDDLVRWRVIHGLVDTVEYTSASKEDIRHLAYRLLGKEDRVYDEYDRLRSEGTFRLGLALPLVALFGTFAYVDSPWWLAGLVVPVVFAYLGGASFAEAEQGLAAAVSSGRVELPALERIRTGDVRLETYDNLVFNRERDLPPSYLEPRRSLLGPWRT